MKKRLALGIISLTATALLVSAVTYAYFQGMAGNLQNTFSIGTVTLEAPAETAFTVSGLLPGREVLAGSFQVKYTGNLEAWLGLDITTAGELFAGATPCLAAVTVSGPGMKKTVSFEPGPDQVVALVETGNCYTFDVFCYMPRSAGEEYTGKSGNLTVLVKAVQASNNTNKNKSGPLAWE